MYRTLVPCIWLLALATSTLASQNPPGKPDRTLPTGVVIPQQASAAKPDQSYALYLPSHYSSDRPWPIVYVFDPDARGKIPVDLMKDAAEGHGYIVAASNNSRNGSWKVETEAAQAMFEDTHARFAIDNRRLYFAGFSGGARVAAALAQQCKCAAGVLLDGAGFAGTPPSRGDMFAVFATVGTFDFNYPELSALDKKLEDEGFPHELRHFDGPHDWAPAGVMEEALAWFRLMAMKQSREARDENFIAAERAAAGGRAHALEQSGQAYEAWREYGQAIATFKGLVDPAPFEQAAAALAKDKSVRDGAKREAQEFEEQKQLTSAIYASLTSLKMGARSQPENSEPSQPIMGGQGQRGGAPQPQDTGTNRSDVLHHAEQQIVSLRGRTTSEKNQEKLRVDRRALSGVFIAAAELGEESLDEKDFALAKGYFQLAADANPDSVGILKALATARALDSDRGGALEALQRAKQKSADPAAFSAWLSGEPAFAKLREDPQFRALLANP
ncbi:MAG TPA: hypothetical protein VKB58_17390 [Terriglobales bacterium]|nr:hypothetical protein [Terriglobales bacterium]